MKMEVNDDRAGRWPVLVLGDSWARYRRLDDGLRQALVDFDPRIVSMGLTGHSARDIAKAWPKIAHPLPRYELAVLMVGVNDAFQHLGATTYARGVHTLSALMPAERIMVVELPRITGDEISGALGRMKHRVYRWLFEDGGDTIDAYRRALRDVDLVEIDRFPMTLKDGVHLTDEGYQRFGLYLGLEIRKKLALTSPVSAAC